MIVDTVKLVQEASRLAKIELEGICLEEIHRLGITKTHTDLLGSHTVVTYPPLDALREINSDLLFSEIQFQNRVDAYMHIPFCEYPCKMCPYTTIGVRGKDGEKIPGYIDALKTEITTWAKKLNEQGAQVRSLYVGGGTPFAIPEEDLEDILSFTKRTLPFIDLPEICVETSPRATLQKEAKEKLQMLRKLSVTRMSIGIQSFDFESLKDMARTFPGHTSEDEERAVRTLLNSDIPNVNMDMIQDLPIKSREYLERLQHDLLRVAQLKPQHVTWYNLRLRPETTYARQKEGRVKLVTEEESLHTRLTIWNFMESIGYVVLEGDRFALAESYEDQFRKTRGSVTTDLLGMGVSAYSHVQPGFFQNTREIGSNVRADSQKAIEKYMKQVREKGHAITYGFPLTRDELLAGKFALGLKKGVSHEEVHKALTWMRECGAYNNAILHQSSELIDAGLLEVREGRIQFTRKGRLFENEICARFYSPRVIHAAHERRGTLTPEITSRYEQYRGRQELDQIAAEQRPQFMYLS
ncbi:MAG: radical SAM protein [Candidatus Woesearchaeota archaeon]|nr:radical SAM protein [Candidatus Woesearchaeota archaeon]